MPHSRASSSRYCRFHSSRPGGKSCPAPRTRPPFTSLPGAASVPARRKTMSATLTPLLPPRLLDVSAMRAALPRVTVHSAACIWGAICAGTCTGGLVLYGVGILTGFEAQCSWFQNCVCPLAKPSTAPAALFTRNDSVPTKHRPWLLRRPRSWNGSACLPDSPTTCRFRSKWVCSSRRRPWRIRRVSLQVPRL